jgi:peroxiredoxin
MRALSFSLLTFCILVLGALVLGACGVESRRPSPEASAGASSVEFRLASLDGSRLGPQDFRGQVVLFDFWATWCRPCHVQADILKSIHAEFDELGVAFVAVSLGEPESTVRTFTAKRPFAYPVLIDPADDVSNQLGIYVLPTIMILDAEGGVAYLHEGVSSARRLRHVLQETLKGVRTASL